MSHYPDTVAFQGILNLNRFEADLYDLEISGTVPADLEGYFYRVHPDQQFPPRYDNDQFFNGDGMISRFHFHDGKIDFRQRWARTNKWVLENKAGKALFGAYRNPLTDDDAVKGEIRSTANTTPIVHAGKLLALKEDGPPLVMDAITMETLGFGDFDGAMKNQTFSAHPKIDPDSGNLCNFGYAATGLLTDDVSYMEISPQGELLFETFFKVPYYCMMHDFAITEHYALFNIMPQTSNWDRLKANKPHFGFDPSLPVYLGVLPRDPEDKRGIRFFKHPVTNFCSHVMNAYEQGDKIHFFIPQAEGNCFPFFPDINDAPFEPEKAAPKLTEWIVDINSADDSIEAVIQRTDLIGEFPRIDDRWMGKPHRHGWMLTTDSSREYHGPGGRASGLTMNVLAHLDLENHQENLWWPGPQELIQEPCFIPKPGSSVEGDGYLMCLVDNVITNYSHLALFHATQIQDGPIARIKLPFRLRSGLHGTWATAGQAEKGERFNL